MASDLSQMLAQIPPDELTQIPAGEPPAGVEPNFQDPVTIAPTVIIVGSVFFAVAAISVMLRIYSKSRIVRKLGWDDGMLDFRLAIAWLKALLMLIPSNLLTWIRESHGSIHLLPGNANTSFSSQR